MRAYRSYTVDEQISPKHIVGEGGKIPCPDTSDKNIGNKT